MAKGASADAQTLADAGDGGLAGGAGSRGGAGGIASGATATAIATQFGMFADALVEQVGGAGGGGINDASGGNGASSSLTNAATGRTDGGGLSLTQDADAGYGGGSEGGVGGAGGAALSSLTLDDTKSATQSDSLFGAVEAQGGWGGGTSEGNGAGGQGGEATAIDILKGVKNVSSQANAFGGDGGLSLGGSSGAGGTATAESSATGVTVTSDADAIGGSGAGGAGSALATAIGVGSSGTAQAESSTSLPESAHVNSISAQTNADVIGSTTITSESLLQAKIPGFITSGQALAIGVGSPDSASTNTILAANTTISASFGGSPSILAVEEVGGGYSVKGKGSETTLSEVTFNANLNTSDKTQDLKLGFFSGSEVGSGITGVKLAIYANGIEVIAQSFGSGAAASSYFNDKVADIGSLASGNFSGGFLNLEVSLQVTADKANSGFYGGLIVSG
jgi:hypothetical protein